MDIEGFDTRYLDESKQKDTVIPRFYVRSIRNEAKSRKTGEVVYEDREFVELRVPGDRLNVVDAPVNETHKARWPQWYKAFLEKRELRPEGFLLSAWPLATPALVSTLAQVNCHTVEQLAEMAETALPRFTGIMKIQGQAREWVQAKSDAKVINQLQHTKETLEEQLALQADTIKALQERLAALEGERPAPAVKRTPGRPRKAQ